MYRKLFENRSSNINLWLPYQAHDNVPSSAERKGGCSGQANCSLCCLVKGVIPKQNFLWYAWSVKSHSSMHIAVFVHVQSITSKVLYIGSLRVNINAYA